MYYDYNYLKEKKVAVGWLDLTSKIKDTTALALTKNITEFWIQENANYHLKTCCFDNVDKILNWTINQDINYLLVLATGNHLVKDNQLIHELPDLLENNKDCVLFGHILDKKDNFYELHHQCFIVDINWWKSVKRPKFGNEEHVSWKTLEPIRSIENWHDDYTPHWIKKGKEIKTYSGRRQGWNLIDLSLKTRNKIFSFNERIRNSKVYIYPEVENDFHRKLFDVLDMLQANIHFVANTESPPTKMNKKLSGVICTSGGITPLLCSYSANLKPGDKLTIFDCSSVSLNIQKKIRQSNFDFKNFKKSFYDLIKDFDITSLLKAEPNIDTMQKIINFLMPRGLEDFIINVWPTLNVNYRIVNLFNINSFNSVLSEHINEPTLIHLTNILHYQNTASLYSSKHRYRIEKDLLDLFLKYGPDKYYLYQNRPGKNLGWRYVTPKEISNNKERYLKTVEELEILPWMK
jgi:hypothetical protein